MPTRDIHIKSSRPEKAVPLLKDAIERERKLILHSISVTRAKIDKLASSLKVREKCVRVVSGFEL